MHLITVPLSAQIHKETKSDRLYTKRQHVGNYSSKPADTELYIYQTLLDTLSDCAPWFSCCFFPAASESPSLALLLHRPAKCWDFPARFWVLFFLYTHSLRAQASGWFLFDLGFVNLSSPHGASLLVSGSHWAHSQADESCGIVFDPSLFSSAQ